MAKLTKGHTYNPGDIVDAADLNSLVDNAGTLYGIIMEQTAAVGTADPTDDVLLVQGGTNLRRANVSQLIQGTSSVNWNTGNPAPTTIFSGSVATPTGDALINLGLKNQTGNKALLSPLDGTSGVPGFRVLAPADITPTTVPIAVWDIDWTLGNVFTKTLPASGSPFTFTLSNLKNGQTIKVRVKQNAAGDGVVNWNAGGVATTWLEGAKPNLATTPNAFGIYVFVAITEIGTMRLHGYLEDPGGSVTTVSAAATPTSVFNVSVANPTTAPAIALSLDTQVANTVLAGPVSGADAVPAFRALTPADIVGLTGFVALGLGFNIDLTLGNAFWKVFSTTTPTLTFVTGTGTPGQVFKVWVKQTAGTATTLSWVAGGGTIRWPGGVAPVFTPTPLAIDVFEFFCTAANTFEGIRWGANFA